jgi:eukaryotic-like serine/threonine-protein kinase
MERSVILPVDFECIRPGASPIFERPSAAVPVPSGKTEAHLIDPRSANAAEEEAAARRRAASAGRPNLLKLGTVLQNRYRVLDVLGIGGMSTVYKARDLRFTTVDRGCAIKEMFNTAEEAKLRQLRLANFHREASLLATMTHSAVPRIYDFFEQQGTIYLVLELIVGQDLETILATRTEPFSEAQVIDWAISLCSVLRYLHGQQPEPIIFRDLKPSNIMIRTDDQALVLIDFGIARTFAPMQKGTMIGTEGYASPEQYKGIADARGDIYAFGATLHHLATGNDPRSETPFTFAQRPPRKLNPSLSQAFEDVILRCVSYDPGDRYQSAVEVQAALEAIRNRGSAAPRYESSTPISAGVEASVRHRDQGSSLLSAPAMQRSAPVVKPAETVTAPVGTVDDRLEWTLNTGDEVRGSASAGGGAVYVGSYDGHMYALDETDGSVRWKFKAQRGIVSRPAVAAEMLVFGSEDKSIYSVARQNGRLMWSIKTNMAVRSSPIADERACIVGSDDGFLYRLDRVKGVVTWRYKTFGPIRSSPTQCDTTVIFGSDDGYLYNVQADTGQLTWRKQVGAAIMSTAAQIGPVIAFGASDGYIRGFNLKDGKPVWSLQTAKTVISSPVTDGVNIYVGSADGHMYAINGLSGELAWKSQICRQITSSPTLDGANIYVGGNDGNFYCLDTAGGAIQWQFAAGGAIVSKPLVTDDHIIFGSLDGNVYALTRNK